MKPTIKERIAKLIDVKSLVTISLTIVFCILSTKEGEIPSEFLAIYTAVIGFYFGTQSKKDSQGGNK